MNKIIELGKTAIHICKEKKVCSKQNKKNHINMSLNPNCSPSHGKFCLASCLPDTSSQCDLIYLDI